MLEIKVAKERELNKDEELAIYEMELKKLREGKHNPQRIIHERSLKSIWRKDGGSLAYCHHKKF